MNNNNNNNQTLSLPSSPIQTRKTNQFHPIASTSNNINERTSLLRSSSYTSNSNNSDWADTLTTKLKRKSAVLSDVLSGRSHSAWTEPAEELLIEEEGNNTSDYEVDDDGASTKRGSGHDGVSSSKRSTRGGGYDGEFRKELQGENGSGVRQWYENFTSIDWLHDNQKHSIRTKKLRSRMRTEGLRGILANLIDGSQGWILVTLTGFFTACIAFLIINSEMLLFDLKEGYCSTNFRLAKRFCCKGVETLPVVVMNATATFTNEMSPFMQGWSTKSSITPACENWRTWGQVWTNSRAGGIGGIGDLWIIDYGSFVIIAVLLSTTASALTIYLSSSTSVFSSKDSVNVPHPGFAPDNPLKFARTPTVEYGSNYDDNDRASVYSFFPKQLETGKLPLPLPKPRKVMYFAAGSGIPEIKTILSGFVIRGYLGSFTLATKSVGLALSVASGLSLGKEGPMVHIASCVGNIASRFFPKYDRNEARRREIISAACAAGVAVSFGAPVGGTLFSLEEVSYFFPPRVMWRSFFCAMIAATTLKLLDPFGSGKIVLFQVTYDRDWNNYELFSFISLGIFGGVYGALFCKANIWWTRNVRNGTSLKSHPIIEVALVTLVTVLISFRSSFLSIGGTELVFELFSECHGESTEGLCIRNPDLVLGLISSLGIALILKAMVTVTTFGIKLPAGIFIPTLAVGALAGRILGLSVELLHARQPDFFLFDGCDKSGEFGQACVIPGLYAMIGAAGALAGVTRTTVSLAVIMFELTGTLSYTVPVMLSVLAAKTVADAIEPRSIYDLVIELSDLPYLDIKTEYLHESSLDDIKQTDAAVIDLDIDNTLEGLTNQLAKLYEEGSGSGFPIVAKESGGGIRMYGYISSKELEHGLASASSSSAKTKCTFNVSSALRAGIHRPSTSRVSTPGGSIDFSWLVENTPLTINERSPMELAHELFSKLGVRHLIIVDERGLYTGLIEKNRYLAYLKWLEKTKHDNKWKEGKGTSSSHA